MIKNGYKICFVCTGNACRSPFAECMTKFFLNKEGLDNIEVYSCGTLDWGENPRDEGMCHVAKLMGYELTGVTTPMTRDLLEKADLIIVFETKHRNEITRVLDYNQWNKISLFNQLAFGENKDMEDPHMQSESTYKRIATQIEKGCEQLVQHMKMEILQSRTSFINVEDPLSELARDFLFFIDSLGYFLISLLI